MPRRSKDRSDARTRAEEALTDALQKLNPKVKVERGRVERLKDNLCPGIVPRQFERDLRRGAGNELRDKFLAPYSSSALAVNTFARFKGFESDIRIGEWDRFECVEFEQEFPTGLRGTPPHLDVVLTGPNGTLAIESKCIEHLGTKEPIFRDAYEHSLIRDRQSKQWLDEMLKIREDRRRYSHLDAAQLVKHAFGLANSSDDRTVRLLYLYWEPRNASQMRELKAHQKELKEFKKRVAGGRPLFHAMSYREIWAKWEKLDQPTWLREHVRNLRSRYDVEI